MGIFNHFNAHKYHYFYCLLNMVSDMTCIQGLLQIGNLHFFRKMIYAYNYFNLLSSSHNLLLKWIFKALSKLQQFVRAGIIIVSKYSNYNPNTFRCQQSFISKVAQNCQDDKWIPTSTPQGQGKNLQLCRVLWMDIQCI